MSRESLEDAIKRLREQCRANASNIHFEQGNAYYNMRDTKYSRSSWYMLMDEVYGYANHRRKERYEYEGVWDNWTKGGEHYKRNDPHDSDPFGVNDPPSGWSDPVLRDRPWPYNGNYIHEYYVVSSIAGRNYAINPPVIYMYLSFDGTWYPKELSDPNYKHVNYFKP